MSHHLRRLALVAAGALLTVPWAVRPAAAATLPTLTVSVTVDQPTLVVDKSPGVPAVTPVLTHTIHVTNTTTDPAVPPAHGVEVVDTLPSGLAPVVPLPAGATASGNTVTFDVGALGFGAWQAKLQATVVSTTAGQLPFSDQATVTTTDGEHVVSAPAVTLVNVISAITIDRSSTTGASASAGPPSGSTGPGAAPEPAASAKVLGATLTRDPGGAVVGELAASGAPVGRLAMFGLVLVLVGSGLVRLSRRVGFAGARREKLSNV